MCPALLADVQARAAAVGLNLFGVVDTERFDRSQPCEARCARVLPGSGTAIVLGSGGHDFWRQLLALHGARPLRWRQPLRRHAVAAVQPLQTRLAEAGVPGRMVAPVTRTRINVARLAEAAGFGIVSPVVGVLLHPRFGPWVGVRAVLLFPGQPFGPVADTSIADSFQPCGACPRPCVSACPVGVHDGLGGSDFERCSSHRQQGGCTHGCNVRRACPVGAGERYQPEVELLEQQQETLHLERRYGFSFWRLLQRLLCR